MFENTSRRAFLKQGAVVGTAMLLQDSLSPAMAQKPEPAWRDQIGLELYTVRDVMANDFEGVLAKVAQIGYKEIEPATGFNNMDAKAFRALLDRYGLGMPSTHTGYPSADDPGIERKLEALQVMGVRYTEIRPAGVAPAAQAQRRQLEPGAYYDQGTGITHNAFKEAGAFGPYQPKVKLDAVKKRAAELNANGKVAHRFGMKLFVHNHTGEFEKLLDSDQTMYDVLLAETDPELVTMQLDIGWACIAGMDPVEIFRKNPGRYELWHIKDVFGLKTVNKSLSPNERVSSMSLVPVGTGQIDYKPIFAQAKLAGLKHFVVEQDNAAAYGDSVAAARVSHQNLRAML
ncbi:sugar phosphate isomerase/epimerase family protein [Terriglobus albidus]|uniref:sugar phosphate isomerase/epimerase family protein n=1 Tax=Terriglobus albidus TaxID=1592106 RepID=UPI0021E0D009|nr:sugar phosphate isomerase/epimerase [Terriglobus albidus]